MLLWWLDLVALCIEIHLRPKSAVVAFATDTKHLCCSWRERHFFRCACGAVTERAKEPYTIARQNRPYIKIGTQEHGLAPTGLASHVKHVGKAGWKADGRPGWPFHNINTQRDCRAVRRKIFEFWVGQSADQSSGGHNRSGHRFWYCRTLRAECHPASRWCQRCHVDHHDSCGGRYERQPIRRCRHSDRSAHTASTGSWIPGATADPNTFGDLSVIAVGL